MRCESPRQGVREQKRGSRWQIGGRKERIIRKAAFGMK
ncbi:hypothetical protein V512_010330 [Mesotoga sp. Brook.08.105.5.1]|nr:hypothetical protein V512_010330 [Mesotoga sp. Brook.08.105.5.1]RAO98247.1 hypothetical protein M388_00010 [Mesotoga sp. Brook.08.YT.4.2.5.4.]